MISSANNSLVWAPIPAATVLAMVRGMLSIPTSLAASMMRSQRVLLKKSGTEKIAKEIVVLGSRFEGSWDEPEWMVELRMEMNSCLTEKRVSSEANQALPETLDLRDTMRRENIFESQDDASSRMGWADFRAENLALSGVRMGER